jgi:hypothetical protein
MQRGLTGVQAVGGFADLAVEGLADPIDFPVLGAGAIDRGLRLFEVGDFTPGAFGVGACQRRRGVVIGVAQRLFRIVQLGGDRP